MRTRAAAERVFADLVGAYIANLRARQYAPRECCKVVPMLRRFWHALGEQGVFDVRQVEERHVLAYMRRLRVRVTSTGRPLALQSQAAYMCRIRGFFAFLEKRGYVLVSPARELELPRPPTEPRWVLTQAEARRLMGTPPAYTLWGRRDRAILETLYGTGLRASECLKLDLGDLDLERGLLLVREGKGRKDRMVPVPGAAQRALWAYLKDVRPEFVRSTRELALFVSGPGRRLSQGMLRVMVMRRGQQADIEKRLSPHVLRHSCATHLIEGGADVRHVQRLLGHTSIQTTAVYTHLGARHLREVLERAHPREKQLRRPRAR